MKRVDVVLGIVVVSGGNVLICRRRAADPLGGLWEFPGGKVEPGESLEQCLARELAEELGIQVRIIEPMPPIEHDYPAVHVRLHPFLCAHVAGDPRPLAAAEVLAVAPKDLPRYRMPPANDPMIRWLVPRLAAERHDDRARG